MVDLFFPAWRTLAICLEKKKVREWHTARTLMSLIVIEKVSEGKAYRYHAKIPLPYENLGLQFILVCARPTWVT